MDYAGLKDKHAVTTQHVSVPERELSAEPPERLTGAAWDAEFLGWAPAPLSAEAIEANRFTIVVRDLTAERAQEMSRRRELLSSDPETLRIVNYFGDQRFGSARHGRGFAARALIAGDFEGALRLLIGTPARKDSGRMRAFTRLLAQKWGDWAGIEREAPRMAERRAVEALARGGSFKDAFSALPNTLQVLAVEAYQSHLWNATARVWARSIDSEALLADDDFGAMLFPRATAVSDGHLAIEAPLLSSETRLEGPWADATRAALDAEGLALADLGVPGLRRPRFGESWRPLIASVSSFEMSDAEPDDMDPRGRRLKRVVRFELPRGAYATVVLRALGE